MIYTVCLPKGDDFAAFRSAARRLLSAHIAPVDVVWSSGSTLFPESFPSAEKALLVARTFGVLADAVTCHRDDTRWPLLYQALWRIDQGERGLMDQACDPLMHRLHRMAAAIKRDQHRMTAFVRFRKVSDAGGDRFVCWYEPQHYILRRTAAFFVDRFASMRFSIFTPDLTLHWEHGVETYLEGLRREDAAGEDGIEDWWRQYYAAIFNPARTNVRLMARHMPKRYWRDLPEANSIPALIADAGPRTDRMIKASDQETSSQTGAVSTNAML
jgi:probable DNA metabolism protein